MAKRSVAVVLILAVAVLVLGCGTSPPASAPTASQSSTTKLSPTPTLIPPPRFEPEKFGENGTCYFIYVPDEVKVLKTLKKCSLDPKDPAKRAPNIWLARYFAYYTTIWYDANVLPSTPDRGNYVDYIHVNYGTNQQFRTLIQSERRNASYRDTQTGRIVKADKAGISSDGLTMAGPP